MNGDDATGEASLALFPTAPLSVTAIIDSFAAFFPESTHYLSTASRLN